MLLIDNNLSPKIAFHLQAEFPGIKHVIDFGLGDSEDQVVWECAVQKNLNILTKDSDFVAMLTMFGFPPKVIRLNCGNVSTAHIRNLLIQESSIIYDFLESPQHGLLTIY